MFEFDCVVRARPPSAVPGAPLEIAGVLCRPLAFPPEELATSLAVTFEETLAALEQLERLYVEPDGSFVWVAGDRSWQVDGNFYDRDERLLFVELRGTAPSQQFDQLLAAFGWPAAALAFECRQAGVFVDEADFRRVAHIG